MATVYLARDLRHDRDVVRGDPASGTSLRLVFNWFEELPETVKR